MLRNAAFLTFFVSGIVGLAGCHLYLDEDRDDDRQEGEMWPDDCREIDCGWPEEEPDRDGPERPDRPDGDEPPTQSCESDQDCTRGCFCNDDSVCEESGWCFGSGDCSEGFVCNRSGTCVPAEPPPPPAATCEDHGTEAACVADESCDPVYRGVNCTAEGGDACTSESAECTCESFAFDRCE